MAPQRSATFDSFINQLGIAGCIRQYADGEENQGTEILFLPAGLGHLASRTPEKADVSVYRQSAKALLDTLRNPENKQSKIELLQPVACNPHPTAQHPAFAMASDCAPDGATPSTLTLIMQCSISQICAAGCLHSLLQLRDDEIPDQRFRSILSSLENALNAITVTAGCSSKEEVLAALKVLGESLVENIEKAANVPAEVAAVFKVLKPYIIKLPFHTARSMALCDALRVHVGELLKSHITAKQDTLKSMYPHDRFVDMSRLERTAENIKELHRSVCCNEQQEYILEKAQGLMEIVAHAKGLLPPSHEHAAFFDEVHVFCQESLVYIPTASAIHLIVCDQASGKDKSLLAAEAADIIEFFHEMGYWCHAESDSARTKPIIHEYFKAQLLEMAVKSDAFKDLLIPEVKEASVGEAAGGA